MCKNWNLTILYLQCMYVYPKMLCLVALVCWASTVALGEEPKIIGGEEAVVGQFPSVVSLQDRLSGKHYCGGALISDRIVLTAAHCLALLPHPALTVVLVGSIDNRYGGTYHLVSRIVIHERFDTMKRNDIGLLELSEPVTFSAYVQPINLPQAGEITPAGTIVNALGWGTTSFPFPAYPAVLRFVEERVVGNDECSYRLGFEVPISQLCVGGEPGQGLCSGDSGSPLIVNNETVGIVSWGKPCGIGYPDVFTRVSAFVDWIAKHSTA